MVVETMKKEHLSIYAAMQEFGINDHKIIERWERIYLEGNGCSYKAFILKIITKFKLQYIQKLFHNSSPALSTKISFKEGS